MHVAHMVLVLISFILYVLYICSASPSYVAFLRSSRSNETSGGAEETRGTPQPGAAETKAERDEVCSLF